MLIIEGTDLVGKTRCAQECTRMLNEMGLPYIYRWLSRLPDAFPRPDGYKYLACPFYVQDRFHLSELAYCHGRGDAPTMDAQQFRTIRNWLRRHHGAFTVVITTHEANIDARWRDDEMYSPDIVKKVNQWYADHFELADCSFYCSRGEFPDPAAIATAYLRFCRNYIQDMGGFDTWLSNLWLANTG